MRDEGFGDFRDLRRHQQHDVGRDLGERAGDERKELHRLRKAVAGDVPGYVGIGEAELARKCGAHFEPLAAEGGERAGRAAELHHLDTWLQFLEPLRVALKHGEPDGRLVAERDGQRLLQMSAPRHHSIAVLVAERGKRLAKGGDVLANEAEAFAHLKHAGAIHDVLRGRAPMQVAAGVTALRRDLAHERQDRIADDLGLLLEPGHVQAFGAGLGGNRLGRLRRDDAGCSLGFRQRHLDLDVTT